MEQKNNNYYIEGTSVLNLIEKYGAPLYVYNTSKMESQYNNMLKAFSSVKVKINYACKANTNINILSFFNKLGSGLDAVSIQEVQLAIKAGFSPSDIMYTPNCVSIEEIEEAVKFGVKINIDNLSILEQFGLKYGNTIPICIRMNPHIMAGGNSKISTGHIDSKFGISIYQLPLIERIVSTNNMKVEGLHMHTGSDILDIEVFIKGADILFDAAYRFPELEYLDFGSGFKVKYKQEDIYTDINKLGKELSKRFKSFCSKYGREITLSFEPGKYLVSESGFFFAKINVIKQTTSTIFAGIDTGLNHLIRPMFYDAFHNIINISKPSSKTRIYTVVGYICETDTFGWNRKISELSEGDYIAFYNAGAYCFTMASNYNSRYRPAEVMIHKGKDYLIRKREDMSDLTRNQLIYNFDKPTDELKLE